MSNLQEILSSQTRANIISISLLKWLVLISSTFNLAYSAFNCDSNCYNLDWCYSSAGMCGRCIESYRIDGFYDPPSINICVKCIPNCLQCTQATVCQKGRCKTGYISPLSSINEICTQCDILNGYGKVAATWPDSTGQCHFSTTTLCEKQCRQCANQGCRACENDYLICDEFDSLGNSGCIAGFYYEQISKLCLCNLSNCCTIGELGYGCDGSQHCETQIQTTQGQCNRCFLGWSAPQFLCNTCDAANQYGIDITFDQIPGLSDYNQCKQCDASLKNCANCLFDIQVCENCLPGYTKSSNCEQCEDGYYLRLSDLKCLKCADINCIKCDPYSPNICIICATTHVLNQQKPDTITCFQQDKCYDIRCLTCTDEVTKITDPFQCLICIDKYIPQTIATDSKKNSCQPSPLAMYIADGGTVVPVSGDYIGLCLSTRGEYSNPKCILCTPGYMVNEKGECVPYCDIEFCLYCSVNSALICDKCKSNSFGQEQVGSSFKQCIRCPIQHCVQCSSSGTSCDICQKGYSVETSSSKCRPCTISECIQCASPVVAPFTCILCNFGYVLGRVDGISICFQQEKCGSYLKNCALCKIPSPPDTEIECLQCQDGYEISSTGYGCIINTIQLDEEICQTRYNQFTNKCFFDLSANIISSLCASTQQSFGNNCFPKNTDFSTPRKYVRHCSSLDVNLNCLQCKPHYLYDTLTPFQRDCPQIACFQFLEGCQKCRIVIGTIYKCDICYPNYQLNSDDECVKKKEYIVECESIPNCLQCHESGDESIMLCSQCHQGYFPSPDFRSCLVNQCGLPGMYFDADFNKCLKCSPHCLQCRDDADYCTKCANDRYHPPLCQCSPEYQDFDIRPMSTSCHIKICANNVDSSSYLDMITNTCQLMVNFDPRCDYKLMSITISQCLQCANGSYLSETGLCESLSSSIKDFDQCLSDGSTNKKAIFPSKVIKQLDGNSKIQGLCVECPDNCDECEYDKISGSGLICKKCKYQQNLPPLCQDSTSLLTSQTGCIANSYKTNDLGEQLCSSCPPSYTLVNNRCIIDQNNLYCSSSIPNCVQCYSYEASIDICTECEIKFYLDIFGACQPQPSDLNNEIFCGVGIPIIISDLGYQQCQVCPKGCSSCSISQASPIASPYQSVTYPLFQVTCPDTCKQGYQFLPDHKTCRLSKISYTQCRTGFYFDFLLNNCNKCPQNCDVCSSRKLCQVCANGYTFNIMRRNCQAIQICQSTEFYDGQSNQCLICSDYLNLCGQCTGRVYNYRSIFVPNPNVLNQYLNEFRFQVQCTKCQIINGIEYQLAQQRNACGIELEDCLTEQVPSYYEFLKLTQSFQIGFCRPCPSDCNPVDGCVFFSRQALVACNSCKLGFYPVTTYYQPSPIPQVCMPLCPTGFYFRLKTNTLLRTKTFLNSYFQSNTCLECLQENCVACQFNDFNSEKQIKCLMCSYGYVLLLGKCVAKFNSKYQIAASQCPRYSFFDFKTLTCVCHFGKILAKTELGGSEHCIQSFSSQICNPGYFRIYDPSIYREACVPCYVKTINLIGEIQFLPNICVKCSSAIDCQQCITGYYYDLEEDACIACPFGCDACKSKTWCESCQTGFYINEYLHFKLQLCVETCPSGSLPSLSSYFELNPFSFGNSNFDLGILLRQSQPDLSIDSSKQKASTCNAQAFASNGKSVCNGDVTKIPADFFTNQQKRCVPCLQGCGKCNNYLLKVQGTSICVNQCLFPYIPGLTSSDQPICRSLAQTQLFAQPNVTSSILRRFRSLAIHRLTDPLQIKASCNYLDCKYEWRLRGVYSPGDPNSPEIQVPMPLEFQFLTMQEESQAQRKFQQALLVNPNLNLKRNPTDSDNSKIEISSLYLQKNVIYSIELRTYRIQSTNGVNEKIMQHSSILNFVVFDIPKVLDLADFGNFQVWPQVGMAAKTIFNANLILKNEYFGAQRNHRVLIQIYPKDSPFQDDWNLYFESIGELHSYFQFQTPITYNQETIIIVEFNLIDQGGSYYRGIIPLLTRVDQSIPYPLAKVVPQYQNYLTIYQIHYSILSLKGFFDQTVFEEKENNSLLDIESQNLLYNQNKPNFDNVCDVKADPLQMQVCFNQGSCYQYSPFVTQCKCVSAYDKDFQCRIYEKNLPMLDAFNLILENIQFSLTDLNTQLEQESPKFRKLTSKMSISSIFTLSQLQLQTETQINLFQTAVDLICQKLSDADQVDFKRLFSALNNLFDQIRLNDDSLFYTGSFDTQGKPFKQFPSQVQDLINERRIFHSQKIFKLIETCSARMVLLVKEQGEVHSNTICTNFFCTKFSRLQIPSISYQITDSGPRQFQLIVENSYHFLDSDFSKTQIPIQERVRVGDPSISTIQIPFSLLETTKNSICILAISYNSTIYQMFTSETLLSTNVLDFNIFEDCDSSDGPVSYNPDAYPVSDSICYRINIEKFQRNEQRICLGLDQNDPNSQFSIENCRWDEKNDMCCCKLIGTIALQTQAYDFSSIPTPPDTSRFQTPIDIFVIDPPT